MTDPGTTREDTSPASPFVTVIAPVRGAGALLPLLVSSLAAHKNAEWELLIVGSSAVAAEFESRTNDARVHIMASEESELAGLVNAALDQARGDFVMIAPRDGSLADHVVQLIQKARRDEIDVLYGNEDISRGPRKRPRHIMKPAFSPERLRCQFYIGDPVFYRASLLRELGGLRPGLPGAELYDLALRATRRARQVEHVPQALFELPPGADVPGVVRGEAALASTRRALEEHLAETGGGVVDSVDESGVHTTRRLVSGDPLVSIVIPTRGSYGLVHGRRRCMVVDAVRSIIEKSTYANYELVIVMDDVAEEGVIAELREIAGDRLNLVWWRHPFNFSAKVNFGAYHSRGEYLLFLNDDTEVISPGWLEALVSLCQRPGAGMSGAMLYFEDDTIQHAGHLYEGGDAGHIGTDFQRGAPGPQGAFQVEREAPGVTAACSLMPKEVFERAGGFSLQLPNNFNDVDLCMKVNQLGYRIYWTPHAELFHYESKTRVSRVTRYEVETAWGRWEWKLDDRTYWPYGVMAD